MPKLSGFKKNHYLIAYVGEEFESGLTGWSGSESRLQPPKVGWEKICFQDGSLTCLLVGALSSSPSEPL